MEFRRTNNLLFCSDDDRDLDYVQAVAELVLARYTGEGHRWRPARSDQLWRLFTGGRAGVVGVRHEGRVACVKLFYDDRRRTKVRTLMGLSKARRAYRNGLRLRQLGITCPRMIGYAERRPVGPALLVTELIEDATRIDHWVPRHGVQQDAVAALAHFVCGMHDRGVSHVDLSPRNILVRRSEAGIAFFLLDYEDVRFATEISPQRRIEDLHHLHERVVGYVPLGARLRFLRAYAPQDYVAFRDALRRRIEQDGFRWLRDHAGPNTTSTPSQGMT